VIIGVFGLRSYKGKEYNDYNRVADVLDGFQSMKLLVSGGGRGIEQLALRYANECGIEPKVVPPNISAYGPKVAFIKRNEEIIQQIDLAVVFWDGKEQYYVDLMSNVVNAGKVAHVIHVEDTVVERARFLRKEA
jgi:hypothetical protein